MPSFKRFYPYLVLFFLIQTLLRLSLLVRGVLDVDFTAGDILQLLIRGFWFDIVTAGFFLLPLMLYHLLLPARLHGGRLDRRIDTGLRFLFIFILVYDAVAEHLFWSEFTTRFNFIAVDYLVYTQEVIGNIVESYPIGWIIAAIVIAALLITYVSLRAMPLRATPCPLRLRAITAAGTLAACVALYMLADMRQAQFGENAEANEIAANGIYNLFYAFSNNEISYERFYAMEKDSEVRADLRELRDEPEMKWIDDFTRLITPKGKEIHKNVIIVSMESMSAAYMDAFGGHKGLTPNLDALAKEGLFFTNLYATGTRTVRGLEAMALSIPPTPGQSLVRRPGNHNLFSLGFIFKDRGYDTRFIYGGYGYFDNMNDFFAGNGFDVIDRTNLAKDEVQFANVWGVCDEDIAKKVIAEADKSYANGKHFMHLWMTTSNHRPYTYPDGRIDIASHEGRFGGVKYADYSVGKLIEGAKDKPWFKDTVFVFVADHTAGATGKAELDPEKYHIPMIFYSPGFIKPARFEHIASQIDMGPILLGQLNFTYYTKFYGEDLLHDDDEIPHAFISNFQKVALVRDDGLTVLSPKRGIQQYEWPDASTPLTENDELVNDTITYYQSASWWHEHYQRIPTVAQ